jgi:hypothetical protein
MDVVDAQLTPGQNGPWSTGFGLCCLTEISGTMVAKPLGTDCG